MSTTTKSQNPVSVKTFNEDGFTLTHSILPGCKHKFEIQVTPDYSNKMYLQAIKNVNKEVSVPGFRKGKAPEQYIKANFDKAIQGEWKDLVTNETFRRSAEVANAFPRTKDSVEGVKVNSLSREDGADITIQFESFPVIPEVKASDLHLEKSAPEPVTQKDVDDALYQIQLSHATWADLDDQAAEKDGWVIADIEGTEDGETFSIGKDVRIHLKTGSTNPWLINLVVGKKAGDIAEGMSEAEPESAADFKPTLCKVTIKKVQTPVLPELNQEFAEKLKISTIEELRPKIEEELIESNRRALLEKQRLSLIKQIHDKYTFDVPMSFVESDIAHEVNHYVKQLRKENLSEDVLKEKTEEFEKNKRKTVEDSFRLYILSQKISREQNIQVTQDEIMRELMTLLYSKDPKFANLFQSEEGVARARDEIHTQLLITKVLDYLVEKVCA